MSWRGCWRKKNTNENVDYDVDEDDDEEKNTPHIHKSLMPSNNIEWTCMLDNVKMKLFQWLEWNAASIAIKNNRFRFGILLTNTNLPKIHIKVNGIKEMERKLTHFACVCVCKCGAFFASFF